MPKLKVFLSYAQGDEDFAKDLATRLSEAGLQVIDPRGEASAGDNLHLKVGQALEKSDAMVVLLSAEALQSPWVRSEIDYALGAPKFEQRLIPVLLEETENIPWILQKLPLVTASRDRNKVTNHIVHHLQGAKQG
jgi:hypothetical protein